MTEKLFSKKRFFWMKNGKNIFFEAKNHKKID